MNRGILSSGCDCDVNAMLNILVDRLDRTIDETGVAEGGMPLFMVEGKLPERLGAVLPGLRFTAEDIRGWAAEISS